MALSDIRKKAGARAVFRGTQLIFGERKQLQEVLSSVRRAKLPGARKTAEIRALEKLIEARTKELNAIQSGWDRKFQRARNPKTTSDQLLRLGAALPRQDYLLGRVLSEHPEAPVALLESLSSHPYSAVRENVARHTKTPAETLRRLAESDREPLWFLVACNPSAPADLRERLRARLRQSSPAAE